MKVLWLLAIIGTIKVVAAVALFTYVAKSWLPLLLLPAFFLLVVVGVVRARDKKRPEA